MSFCYPPPLRWKKARTFVAFPLVFSLIGERRLDNRFVFPCCIPSPGRSPGTSWRQVSGTCWRPLETSLGQVWDKFETSFAFKVKTCLQTCLQLVSNLSPTCLQLVSRLVSNLSPTCPPSQNVSPDLSALNKPISITKLYLARPWKKDKWPQAPRTNWII